MKKESQEKITKFIERSALILAFVLLARMDINNNYKSTGDSFGSAGYTVAGAAMSFSGLGGLIANTFKVIAPSVSAFFNYDAVTKDHREMDATQEHNKRINIKIKEVENKITELKSGIKTSKDISDCKMDIINGHKVDYCDSQQMKRDNIRIDGEIRRLHSEKIDYKDQLLTIDKAYVKKNEFDDYKDMVEALSLPPLLAMIAHFLSVSFCVRTPRKKRKRLKIGLKTFANLCKRNANDENREKFKKLSLQEKNQLDELYHEMVKANGGEIVRKRLWEAAKENKMIGRYEKIKEYWPTRKKIEITERPINVTKIETWRKQ